MTDWVNYSMLKKGIFQDWVTQCIDESKGMNWWLIFSWNNSSNFIIYCINNEDGYTISDPEFLDNFLRQV